VPLIEPNDSTKAALAHPTRYAGVSGLAGAGLGAAAGMADGGVTVLLGAIVGFFLVIFITLFLWRPGGPGRRWAERWGAHA